MGMSGKERNSSMFVQFAAFVVLKQSTSSEPCDGGKNQTTCPLVLGVGPRCRGSSRQLWSETGTELYSIRCTKLVALGRFGCDLAEYGHIRRCGELIGHRRVDRQGDEPKLFESAVISKCLMAFEAAFDGGRLG